MSCDCSSYVEWFGHGRPVEQVLGAGSDEANSEQALKRYKKTFLLGLVYGGGSEKRIVDVSARLGTGFREQTGRMRRHRFKFFCAWR